MDIKVTIEIPEGSAVKYEMNEETGELVVDRIMPTAMRFPFSYGLIHHTLGQDGDALDAIVFLSAPVHPGSVVTCKPLGLLEMEDESGIDHKIVCVPLPKIDHQFGQWNSMGDVPEARKLMIRHFFEHYKDLEPGKWVKLNEWKDAAAAIELINKSKKSD